MPPPVDCSGDDSRPRPRRRLLRTAAVMSPESGKQSTETRRRCSCPTRSEQRVSTMPRARPPRRERASAPWRTRRSSSTQRVRRDTRGFRHDGTDSGARRSAPRGGDRPTAPPPADIRRSCVASLRYEGRTRPGTVKVSQGEIGALVDRAERESRCCSTNAVATRQRMARTRSGARRASGIRSPRESDAVRDGRPVEAEERTCSCPPPSRCAASPVASPRVGRGGCAVLYP